VTSDAEVLEQVDHWLNEVVIGLNLCPFAGGPSNANRIRKVVCEASDDTSVAEILVGELLRLESVPISEVETTLVIVPHCFESFVDYNQFLGFIEEVIEQYNWQGIFQVASFHPDYQFADTQKDDDENLTNRAPYPMFHLLREESLTRAVDNYPGVDEIPGVNIEKMRSLPLEQKKRLFYYLSQF